MTQLAIIKSTGQRVSITTINGGWTTIIDELGTESKVRNSALEAITVILSAAEKVIGVHGKDDLEIERSELDDPDHNDLAELIDDVPSEKRVRHVKAASYNLDNMRKLTSVNGNLSYDCGDGVAKRLERKSLQEVYDIATVELGIPREQLIAKYRHLNPGMQRMNLGNRIRAKASKAARAHIEQLEAMQQSSKKGNNYKS